MGYDAQNLGVTLTLFMAAGNGHFFSVILSRVFVWRVGIVLHFGDPTLARSRWMDAVNSFESVIRCNGIVELACLSGGSRVFAFDQRHLIAIYSLQWTHFRLDSLLLSLVCRAPATDQQQLLTCPQQ